MAFGYQYLDISDRQLHSDSNELSATSLGSRVTTDRDVNKRVTIPTTITTGKTDSNGIYGTDSSTNTHVAVLKRQCVSILSVYYNTCLPFKRLCDAL